MSQTPVQPQRYTLAEFLAISERADERMEFLDGAIHVMEGASIEHELLVANIIRHVGNALEANRSPCAPYGSNLRVFHREQRRVLLPDVTILCPPIERAEESPTLVLNPTVSFEVLSPGSARYDQGTKLTYYAAIRSLRAAVIVASDAPHVTAIRRNSADEDWTFDFASGLDTTLSIPALKLELKLADIYRGLSLIAEPGR